jgi:hypothetical protein
MRLILSILLLINLGTVDCQQIQKDKQYHFYAGCTIGAWGMLTTDNDNLRPLYGIMWATAAGVGKETIDLCGYGTPEWKDLGYTIAGSVISVGIILCVSKIKKSKRR